MSDTTYHDKDWVRRGFMLPKRTTRTKGKSSIFKPDVRNSLMTTATQKFSDTALGGSAAINTVPQFTKTADLRVSSRASGSKGLGRYYSEAHDDNMVLLHIRAGVPQFNSIARFASGGFNPDAASVAATGRSKGLFYNLGKVAGFIVTLPIQPIILAAKTVRFLVNGRKRYSRYYNLKPTMPTYWTAVQVMANTLAVNMKLSAAQSGGEGSMGDMLSDLDQGGIDIPLKAYEILPRLFRKEGGVDIYSVANRHQRLLNQHRKNLKDILEKDKEGIQSSLQQYQTEVSYNVNDADGLRIAGENDIDVSSKLVDDETNKTYEQYMKSWNDSKAGNKEDKVATDEEGKVEETSMFDGMWAWLDEFKDNLDADILGGNEWVTFNVGDIGSMSEHFNNSSKESDIAGVINNIASGARTRNFTFAGGNLSDGVVGKTIGAAISSIGDVIEGAADSVGLGGLVMLAKGGGYIDIPKVYQDSTVTLPSISVSMDLKAPYNNKLSRYTKELIPTLMILALGMPRAVGKQAYTGPFIVEAYCPGRAQIRLGMVDSITVTRGTNNVSYNRDNEAKGINVTFSIVDLSSIVSMPIFSGESVFAEDTGFSDMMATYGALSLDDQVYASNKLSYNIKRKMLDFQTWMSPSARSAWVSGTWPARVIRDMSRIF